MKRRDIEPRRKRRPAARRDDDDDDDSFLIGASRAPVDRKAQYDWLVIDDPEACFQGGIFRWIDLEMSAEERTWPVGIRFQNVHTGRVLRFDGETLLEQEALPLAPAQTQAAKAYPVYAWKKTVTMVVPIPLYLGSRAAAS